MNSGAPNNTKRHWLPEAWPRETRQWVTLVLLLLLAALLWLASRVLLLFFGSVLVALFLNRVSRWFCRHTPLSRGWAMGIVLLLLASVSGLALWLLTPAVERHLVRLASELPQAVAELQGRLKNSGLGAWLVESMPNLGSVISGLPNKLGSATWTTFSVLVDVFVLFFVGLYLAINPARYVDGFVRLFPSERRPRLKELGSILSVTLQRWILGRLLLMLTNAVVTSFGLWLLGMRLPVTLGIFSGLLNFVPNLGPIIAAVPAVVLAFVQGPWMAFYVALFYLGYQMLDGYVLTPLVQRQTVSLPPALTIMSQLFLGVLFGTLGVLFAVPLVASGMIAVKMLYLHDVLGEEVKLPNQGA